MSGTLFLIPNTLGAIDSSKADPLALAAVIPAEVRAITARLDYFVVEHAKTARAYLKAIGTQTPIQQLDLRELNVNTPQSALRGLLAPIEAGRDGGLLSEAGCPAVADPGALLVRLAHQAGVKVKPLVGPSAILLTVMASGLNGQSFAFHGYLPTDATERARCIREFEQRSQKEQETQVFIETPYRNATVLEALASTLDRTTLLCVATDLTLDSEEITTLPAAQWSGKGSRLQKRPAVFAFLRADAPRSVHPGH